ncbi:hypothetical protein BJY04DRAFT_216510 [Aspergillus karnatakaensis]|uniref:CFEM domain-containing protein n=1 Tax=Aspergillus karnatakaensis TaxID=1810916 RepID=UPI003CCE176E
MRFLSTFLLAATASTAFAASTPKELFDEYLPSCSLECAYQVAEDASGCDINDTDCFCTAQGGSTFGQVQGDMEGCLQSSDCENSDYSSMSENDVLAYLDEALQMCGVGSLDDVLEEAGLDEDDLVTETSGGDVPEDAAVTLSARNAVVAAGAMMLLALF